LSPFVLIGYDGGMESRLTKRQIIESAVWLFIGLALVAALAWQRHLDNVAYEARNPLHSKTGWSPNHSAIEIGFTIFAFFGGSAAIGAAIGALTRYQLLWAVAGIVAAPFVLFFALGLSR